MALSRNWIFRISVAGNLFVLVYLALYSTSTSSPNGTTNNYATNNPINPPELPVPNAMRASNVPPPASPADIPSVEILQSSKDSPNNKASSSSKEGVVETLQENVVAAISQGDPAVADDPSAKIGGGGEGGEKVANNGEVDFDSNINDGLSEQLINESRQLEASPGVPKKIGEDYNKIFPCDDYTPRSFYSQRGNYWVLYNYFKGTRTFHCDQSLTYSTHADWTFLDNLVPLLERWQGPISLTLYSPGTDFDDSLKRILYLRECGPSPLVKELVTFHLFFDQRQVPKMKIPHEPETLPVNCSALAETVTFGEGLPTFKKSKKLSYPVNVARNVAREMATTFYVLPSDIELYPNPNLIPDFLEMVRLNDSMLQRPAPKVFVLSIFEVEANVTALPYDKRDLIYMLQNKSAIPFHKYVCADCHRIPKAAEWLKQPFQPGLRVFHIGKRHKPYHHWEPIYIGTKFDPMYDERLSWEGRSDKMTQGYVLCVLDYEFHILDNAFLVHRPGIKRHKVIPKKNPVVAKQNAVIAKVILPELRQIYGTKPGCYV
ncbi:unnamed protein product [Orchesella dallaii]|uniref:Beta-1,4-glucuronyltransferase 1 n=1 Tax=Orchesella dallaii TaxID=48710 RepID=A0ABP1QUU6_9HEXA